MDARAVFNGYAMSAKALLAITVIALASACAENSALKASRLEQAGVPDAYAVDDPACPPPRCFEATIPLPDAVQVTDNRVRIILPKDYADESRRWPVLYLLHDAPGDVTSWTVQGQVYATLEDLPVIAVMPDGGGGLPGWYSDWHDGSYQWETYHMEVMLPYLEQHLRVLGDGHRAIAGPSMGGYGTMRYSVAYPERFAAAAGFSGAVDFLHLDRASALYAYLASLSGVTPGEAIWGDPVQNYARWEAQDPGTHADQFLSTKVYLTSGNGMPGGPHENLPQGVAEYGIEPFLLIMNQSFADTLAATGVEHETWFYGPGYHNWPYYRDGFAWSLPKLMQAIAP